MSTISPAIPQPAVGVDPKRVLLLTSGAIFMAFLDTTVVNIAFPALRASFPATSLANMSWVISGFAVAFAALLAPAGRIADVTGRRKVFLASVLVFTVASLVCAVAPDFGALLGGRVLQGVAAAAMIPSALSVTLAETPPAQRLAAVGVWGAAGSVAAAAGPSLGAILIDATSWRAVFLINVPVGLLIAAGAPRAIPARRPEAGPLPDPIGTCAVALGVGGVVLGLTEGSSWGWSSAATIAALTAGAAAVAFALLRSSRHPAPAVQTALWHSRTFAMANLTSLLAGAALFSWMLAAPLFLTTFWHYSVLRAGLAITPGAVTSMVAAIAIGTKVSQRRQPAAILVSMVIFGCVGMWMSAALGPRHLFLAVWLPAGLIGGAAFGATLTGLTTAAALSVPPASFAGGTALNTTARQAGGALGVAATAAIASAVTSTRALPDVFAFAGAAGFAAALAGAALLLVTARTERTPPTLSPEA
jgi:EmrB/QacA subfamily drug resistance transporter